MKKEQRKFLLPDCKISALKLFPVAQKSGSHVLASKISTGGSWGACNQRKKLGLDFDLRKTCTKFHPKILTLSVSNLGAKNPPQKATFEHGWFIGLLMKLNSRETLRYFSLLTYFGQSFWSNLFRNYSLVDWRLKKFAI
jgi:hypothetical protein